MKKDNNNPYYRIRPKKTRWERFCDREFSDVNDVIAFFICMIAVIILICFIGLCLIRG